MNIETIRNEYNDNDTYINLFQNVYDNLIQNQDIQKSIKNLLALHKAGSVEFLPAFKQLLPCIYAFDNLLQEVEKTSSFYFKGEVKVRAMDIIAKRNELRERFQNHFADQQFSEQAIIRELINCVSEQISVLKANANALKANARDFITTYDAKAIAISSKTTETSNLPETICVGTYKNKSLSKDSNELDSILNQACKEVSVDIRNSGNIIISASNTDNRSENLYNFICRVVLRYYDSFPLGALRVHFYVPVPRGL